MSDLGYYDTCSNKLDILNFNHNYFSINEPIEIYWYIKHYDVKSVAFCDESSTNSLNMFLTICNDLGVKPMYGVRFTVKTIEDTTLETIDTICYAKNAQGIEELKTLCSLVIDSVLRAEDLWENCDNLLIGLDFSIDYSMIDIVENLLEYFLVPDFIFVGEKSFYCACWDKVFEKLIGMPVLICAKENSCKSGIVGSNLRQQMIYHFRYLGSYVEQAVVVNPKIILSQIESYE